MSAVRAIRPAMATPILPPPPPRIKPGTWSLSLGALLATLMVAFGACAAGTALAGHAPPPPARHVHPVPTSRHARTGVAAAATPQAVALASGTIQGVDRQSGALRLLIDGTRYIFFINRFTAFPDRCLQTGDLLIGLHVTLSLPWYMGGQLAARTIGPRFGCNPDGSLRLFHEITSDQNAPIAPRVPGRAVPVTPSTVAPPTPPTYFQGDGHEPDYPTPAIEHPPGVPPYIRGYGYPRPGQMVGAAQATIPIPRLHVRPRGLGEW